MNYLEAFKGPYSTITIIVLIL